MAPPALGVDETEINYESYSSTHMMVIYAMLGRAKTQMSVDSGWLDKLGGDGLSEDYGLGLTITS